MNSWIKRWSELRKKELISYPEEFPVHDTYKKICTYEELKDGFEKLYEIFQQCYEDILTDPAKMLLEVYDMDEYGYSSKEARLSRTESYKYAKVFYVLGYTGELKQNGELYISVNKLKEQCKALKITNLDAYINILCHYGIVVNGLINRKMKSGTDITVSFPDNKNVIITLYIMAMKTKNTNMFHDFCRMNYRLFEDEWSTVGYSNCIETVSDLFHLEQDRIIAGFIHKELTQRGYYYNFQDWNEGPQIRYYLKESDCKRNVNASFWIASMDTEMKFYIRITNMDKALSYINNCPESVINSFLVSDSGCAKRFSGKCVSGVSYQLKDTFIWRCGCCNPNLQVVPRINDYMYYIEAVEIASKKKG